MHFSHWRHLQIGTLIREPRGRTSSPRLGKKSISDLLTFLTSWMVCSTGSNDFNNFNIFLDDKRAIYIESFSDACRSIYFAHPVSSIHFSKKGLDLIFPFSNKRVSYPGNFEAENEGRSRELQVMSPEKVLFFSLKRGSTSLADFKYAISFPFSDWA
jgi:hypothetical protein